MVLKVLPGSPLGQAIAYTLPRWKGLCAYARHGQIEIDNNLVENAIRPLAIHDRLKPEQVKQDVDDSLKKLQTEYIDLLLIHWPSTKDVPLKETLQAFEEVQKEGKTKIFGVSNFPADMLQEAIKISEIHCNQVEYHPFLSQKKILNICKQHDLALTAYRPVAKNAVADAGVLQELSSKYQKSPAQLTLRWLIQQNPVVAIPRSSQAEHIKANLEVFDFELSDEEMAAIHQLKKNERQVNPAFAPHW